jgi:hypothetical protein
MNSFQSNKFKEIGEALIVSGLVTIDQQAEALGLSRSTAWTILRGKHKRSGLSASVINQMLIAPHCRRSSVPSCSSISRKRSPARTVIALNRLPGLRLV